HGGDGRDPQPLVDLGPAGVVDTGDHVVDAEHLPRHPRGDDVGVVAAADGDEGGGRLDARLDEHVPVEPDAGDPASLEAGAEPAKGLWVPVDDGDRMSVVFENVGEGRADPPASHDHYVHRPPPVDRRGLLPPSMSRSPGFRIRWSLLAGTWHAGIRLVWRVEDYPPCQAAVGRPGAAQHPAPPSAAP